MATPSSSTTEVSPRQLVDLGEVWFDWTPSAVGTPQLTGVADSLHKADASPAFIDMGKLCRVDDAGNLVLAREDGTSATVPLRKGLMPGRVLPATAYEILSRHGVALIPQSAFYSPTPGVGSPEAEANRHFIARAFSGRNTETVIAECRDGISVHQITGGPNMTGKPEKAYFIVACHGRIDEEDPTRTQFCTDPFAPEKQNNCLRFTGEAPTNFGVLDQCRISSSGRREERTFQSTKGATLAYVDRSLPDLDPERLYESFLVVLLMDLTGEGDVALPIQRDGETDTFEGSGLSWMTQVMSTPGYKALIAAYQKQFAGMSPTDPKRLEWLRDHVVTLLDPSLKPFLDAKNYSNPEELQQHAVLMALLYSTLLYEASGLFGLSQTPPDQLAWDEAVNTGNPGTILADPAVQATISSFSAVSDSLTQPFPFEVVIRTDEGPRKITRENILGALRASFSRIALSHYAGRTVVASDEKVSDGWPWWAWALATGGALALGGAAYAALRPGEESRGGGNGPVPEPEPEPVPEPEPAKPATGTTSATGQGGGRGRR